FTPALDATFRVVNFGSRSGDFATENGLAVSSSLRLVPVISSDNLSLATRAVTTTEVTSSVNPSVYGQTVIFTATVSTTAAATRTGPVPSRARGTPHTPAPLSGGQALLGQSSRAAGSHTISAVYSPTGHFVASSSAPFAQPVNQVGSTTTVTASNAIYDGTAH